MLIFFFTTFLLSVFIYSKILKQINYTFQKFQQNQIQMIAQVQLPKTTRFLDLISLKFIELSARTKLVVLTSSGSQSVLDLLQQLNQLPFARRKLVLLDCLRDIQFVYIFALLYLLGQFNPWLILFASLFVFFIVKKESAQNFTQIFIYSALFLLFTYDYGLKFFQSIQMFFVENPSWMFISSNGLNSMIFCLLFALIFGLVIRVDFWSMILGYLLVLTGILSISSALALLAGEMLARVFNQSLIRNKYKCAYYQSTMPRSGMNKVLNFPLLFQLIAIVGGLIISVDFSAFNPLQIEISAMSKMKTELFLISSLIFMMCYWFTTMVYGHFAASDK